MTPLHALQSAILSSLVISSLLVSSFFLLEPTIGRTAGLEATSGPFTITQTIAGENSFLLDAANVTMSGPSINGLTGGENFGTTTFAVRSNNALGYYVDIDFEDENGDGQAMEGVVSNSGAIQNYTNGSTTDYNFSTAQPNAVFAFTVDSTIPTTTADQFLSSGSACGSGSDEGGRCWTGASTTQAIRIVDSDSTSASATSSIVFRVYVPSGASPVVPSDTFVATATLSLYTK
jgi:hypothetical protein